MFQKQISNKVDSVLFFADIAKSEQKEQILQIDKNPDTFAMLPNGNAVSGLHYNQNGSAKDLRIWDLDSGKCIKTHKCDNTTKLNALVVLPEELLVGGCNDGHLKIWDTKVWDGSTRYPSKNIRAHSQAINDLALLPNGYLVSSSDDGTIKVWDVTRWQCINNFSINARKFILLPDEKLVSNFCAKTLEVWDMASGKRIRLLEGHSSYIPCFEVLPNGHVISGSSDKTLKVWDVTTGQCIQTLEGHTKEIKDLKILPNGQVISSSSDRTLKVWDVTTGQCIHTIDTDFFHKLILLPNGQVVSSNKSNFASLKIWPRELIYAYEPYEARLFSAEINKNDKIKIIDFSDRILSNTQLPLIAQVLKESPSWQKAINLCPYNNEGFGPLTTFIDDKRISFQLTEDLVHFRAPDDGTILHYLVRLYNKGHREATLKKLICECLWLGVDNLARNKEGKIAAQLATEIGAHNLADFLQGNRPGFDITKIVLDWCMEQGWHDVDVIDGSKAKITLIDRQIRLCKTTPSQTQILSTQNIETTKRKITQTTTTTTNTEQYITLKLDRTLSASDKILMAEAKSQEQSDNYRSQIINRNQAIFRNQNVENNSNESAHSTSNSDSNSSQKTSRTVSGSNWHANNSVTGSAGFNLFGLGASIETSLSTGEGRSSEKADEHMNSHNTSNNMQKSSRNMESNQSTVGKEDVLHKESLQVNETSKRKTASIRDERAKEKQFSIATAKQQQNRIYLTERGEFNEVFPEGYHLISSITKTSWTESKYIDMQYSLEGQIGISRGPDKSLVYLSLYDIFKGYKDVLKQIYPDYNWRFKDNIVYCTISGTYDEHNLVTEKAIKQHPLHRIERLINELVLAENQLQSQSDPLHLAWMVNIIVQSNEINPYVGTIRIRCNPNTDTKFLTTSLLQFVDFSKNEEALIVEELPNGFTEMTLNFEPNTRLTDELYLPKVEKTNTTSLSRDSHVSIRSGLRRVNSSEFKLAFFNQKNVVDQQREAACITRQVMLEACFHKINDQAIWLEVDETTLQLRFDPQRLTQAGKVHINALRLALVTFLNHTLEKQLPAAQKLEVLGQWMFSLNFEAIHQDFIHSVRNKSNHRYFIWYFHNLYTNYFERLSTVQSHLLREQTAALYQELSEAKQEASTIDFDF